MTPRARFAPLRRLDGRVSRRGLLGAGVLAGVLAASGVPLQARSRGGVLRLGLARGVGDLSHPALALAVHDTLFEIGPTGELEGGLVGAWESDGRAWVLALRPDAPFHDGTPLRAADVAASLARHRGGPTGWALDNVERIEALGDDALRLTLREADPDLPLLLAEPGLTVGRHDGVGTGLYRVAEVEDGRLRLLRVAAHRKDGRGGWFDAVEAVALPDPEARLAALLGGEVDVVDPLPPDLATIALEEGFPAVTVQGNRQLHAWAPDGTPARDVDREGIAALWGGAPAADHPLGPLHPSLADLPAPAGAAVEGLRLTAWEGRPTESATFARALAGPWAGIAGEETLQALLRERRFGEAQARVAALAPVTVAAHIPAVTLHAPTLAHGKISPLEPLDGGRIAERWWAA